MIDMKCITYLLSFNSCPPGQNDRHFADYIFNHVFLNEKVRIFIRISLKFVPKGPIDNESALGQEMAWRRRRQAITWTNADPVHWHIYVAPSGDEWMDNLGPLFGLFKNDIYSSHIVKLASKKPHAGNKTHLAVTLHWQQNS